MSPRKRKDEEWRRETSAGLWSVTVGDHGCKVKVRERSRGGAVVLDFHAPNRQVPRATSVRTVRNEQGQLLREACLAAIEEAKRKSAELRLESARAAAQPMRITVGKGFALFHDEEKGGLPPSESARKNHRRARRFWEEAYGAGSPWNRMAPADRDGALRTLKEAGRIATAQSHVTKLRTVYFWLVKKRQLRELEDPLADFDWKKFAEGYEPRRPRFREDEIPKLIAVSRSVDPRLRLFLALLDDSGTRGKAVREAWRSMLDQELDLPPSPEHAPWGWLNLRALKGQKSGLILLTFRERLELVRAIWKANEGGVWVPGYLSELEERYQAAGVDFPLIPGGYLRQGIVRVDSLGAYRPTSYNAVWTWLRDAEKRAGIQHRDWRAFHGLRRAWSDYVHEEEGLDVLTEAGHWSSRDTPEGIYIERRKHGHLAKARQATERRRE